MSAVTPPPAELSAAHAAALLKDMLRIRRLEERCAQLYTETRIRGFLHLYIGEEAVATGVNQALTAEDAVVATYREHGHALLRGVPMNAIMAEMYGKQEGCSRGRGGSMHLFDAARRFYGGSAIVAGGIPPAVGLALADRMQNRSRVTVCFFGEGAVAEGEFHESMNLAELWRLPVLFVCENNLYAMGTHIARSESVTELCRKLSAYAVPCTAVDGMDVLAVEAAARTAVAAVRNGGGPQFLECRTYRFRAHSMFDAQRYRDKAEVAEWMKRCPIDALRRRIEMAALLDARALAEIEAGVAAEVEAAVAFAEAGSWEPVTDLARDLYTPAEAVP